MPIPRVMPGQSPTAVAAAILLLQSESRSTWQTAAALAHAES